MVQECLGDGCAAVAALGLRCISLLCQDDVLEFYAAWRVVQAALPKLPPQVSPDPRTLHVLLLEKKEKKRLTPS